MAKQYKTTAGVRFINLLMGALVRLGLGPKRTYLLTVRGRKSGKAYTTPVSLVEEGANRWLVAPYGEVAWVRNARAAGEVTLARGGRSEQVTISELDPQASGPVLKQYVANEPITRPYFDAQPDAPVEAFVAEAARHPVFAIHSKE